MIQSIDTLIIKLLSVQHQITEPKVFQITPDHHGSGWEVMTEWSIFYQV